MKFGCLKLTLLVVMNTPAFGQDFFSQYSTKKNSIVNLQAPVTCASKERERLVEKLKGTAGTAMDSSQWFALNDQERSVIVEDLVFATTPHFNRKEFARDASGCTQYGLVPISMARDMKKYGQIQPLSSLDDFGRYVNEIGSKKICPGENGPLYKDAPYRAFFLTYGHYKMQVGFLLNSLNQFFRNPLEYSENMLNDRYKCPGTTVDKIELSPVIDAAASCSSHTDGETLLFDKTYLNKLIAYVSKSRDPFGGVVMGCFPGWK